ncbi:hypothetical protein Pd630_LPD16023 (plasmid) [Rhodococcus opacus PD630]|nr:hypothetical protein Pd630_LPD16023 [Rhodococcus opacus PD630]
MFGHPKSIIVTSSTSRCSSPRAFAPAVVPHAAIRGDGRPRRLGQPVPGPHSSWAGVQIVERKGCLHRRFAARVE